MGTSGFETPPQQSGLVSRRNSSVGSGGSHSGSSWSRERPLLHRSSSAILGSGADKVSPLVLPYADDSDSSLSLDDRSNDSYGSSKTHNDKKQKQQPVTPWACTLSAAFLLHVTGLVHGVWTYRDGTWSELIRAAIGSVTEGLFLLLLLQRLACWTIAAPLQCWRQQTCSSNNRMKCAVDVCRTLAPALAFVLISVFIITSILGDVYYRNESAGLEPSIWVMAAFYLNMQEYIRAKFVADATPDESEGAAAAAADETGSPEAAEAGLSYEDKLTMQMMLCYFGAIALYLVGQLYQWLQRRKNRSSEHRKQNWWSTVDCHNNKLLLVVTVCTLFSYAVLESYAPVTHAFLCFTGRWVYSPGEHYKFDFVPATDQQSVTANAQEQLPNVIYLMHESLSGSILEKTQGGRDATPFFNSLLDSDDFYLFPHARSVSGDTRDCSTALLTGCLPWDEKGRKLAYGRSIGTEFKRRGYATMSVTSYPMNFDQTAWFMMQNFIGGNMDVVVDPLSTGLPKINIEGCDDHELLPYFDKWIKEDVKEQGRPFYGQFYTFNQHYPFLVGANATGTTRYFSSLESFDSLLKHIFDLLKETGQLDNTIIIGSGDHGEHPDLQDYIRLKRFNSDIINTATYMYAPRHLIPSDDDRQRLRHNTQQAVSTLDLFPTLQHFLYGGSASETAHLREFAADTTSQHDRDHCVTGFDLLGTKIPDDRLTVQWNKISQPKSGWKGMFLGALSGKDTGLYVRGRGSGYANIEEFEAWELDYGECTTAWEADCAKELTEERRQHWLETITHDSPSLMLSDQLYRTKHMKLLRDVLEASDGPNNKASLIM